MSNKNESYTTISELIDRLEYQASILGNDAAVVLFPTDVKETNLAFVSISDLITRTGISNAE